MFYGNEEEPTEEEDETETDLTGVEVLTSRGGQMVWVKVKEWKRDREGYSSQC
jgi:hypothetical protein